MEPTSAPGEKPVWSDRRAIALLMAATLTTMANATISPALPGLRNAFAADPNAEMLTRLLVTAPSLSVVLCAPFVGLAADRFGRRRLLLAGVILFVLTGSAGLVLPDLQSIFASRLALGVAVAMIMTAQTALIGDCFTGDRRNALTGLQISARNFGGLAFIALAGWLAAISPRLPFAIYALAGLYLPFMWRVLPTARATHAEATPQAGTAGHRAWKRMIAALASLQMLTNLIFFLMPTQLPFFLETAGYDSARTTGAALGTLMLTGGCAALLYGRLKRAAGYAGAYAAGYLAMAGGFAALAWAGAGWAIFAGVAAIGIGYAIVMPNFVALALTLAPARRVGLAGGVLAASVFLGQFLSPLLSTPAIAAWGYDRTFLALALLLGAMTLPPGAMLSATALRRALAPAGSA